MKNSVEKYWHLLSFLLQKYAPTTKHDEIQGYKTT